MPRSSAASVKFKRSFVLEGSDTEISQMSWEDSPWGVHCTGTPMKPRGRRHSAFADRARTPFGGGALIPGCCPCLRNYESSYSASAPRFSALAVRYDRSICNPEAKLRLMKRYQGLPEKVFRFEVNLSYRVGMPIHPRLVGLARNAVWHDLIQVADQLLAEMKAEAFENDDDRELIKAKGAAEFLESFKKAIESIPVP